MKQKCTEGPYEVFYLVGGEHEIRAPNAANCVVADISCGHQYIGTKEDNHNITEAEATANADLFAASSSLLEAAKNLCDDFGDNKSYDSYRSKLVDDLRAAIAKAEPATSGKE